jgi:signal transduction histidine kinase
MNSNSEFKAKSIKTDERLRRFDRFSEVMRALSTAIELEPFLQKVVSAACELTDSEAASILELDDQNEFLHFLAAPLVHKEALRTVQVPVNASMAGWVIHEQKPLRSPDVSKDDRHFREVDFTLAYQTHTLLAVPLIVRGKALGVLEAVNKNKAYYTEDDVLILETLAAPVALVIHNINLQRRMEASYAQLSELDHLKTDFIAITSHELRTPLGVILGHATFLRELLNETYGEQMDVIIKNASRLKEIIESLASMDNYKTGGARLHQQTVSIQKLIEEVTGSFTDMASDRNITLTTEPGSSDLLVEADATKISIALNNLIKNAIAFTDDGGHVRVKSESLPGYVKVSVIDDGIGIPMKDLPHIFERFFQVESHLTRRHNGMGLGLSVAKVMIEMHGGRIWAESLEGRGSNFSFLLPLKAIEAEAPSQVLLP